MKIDWIRISKKMFILSLWTVPMAVQADDIVVTDGMWKVTYMEGEKAFRINALNEEGAARKCVVNHSASAARYDNTEGEAREVTTASFAEVSYDEAAVDDEFGTGKCYTFTFSLPENGDGVTMKQRFYIYSGQDYMLTDLSLEGDAAIRSNYLAPISVGTAYTLYMSNDGNRMLKVPFDNDGSITWELMVERMNSDLANILGNLVNRTISMNNKYFGGVISNPGVNEPVDDDLKAVALAMHEKVDAKMEKLRVADAITEVFTLLRRCNKYIDETEPWKLAKDETKQDRLATVLYNLMEGIRMAAVALAAYLPDTSARILDMLGTQERDYLKLDQFGLLETGGKVVEKPEILFARVDIKELMEKVEADKAANAQAQSAAAPAEEAETEEGIDIEPKDEITFEEFGKMQFQVGEIISCEAVKKSKKLLCSQVKIGSQVKQIVSGIKGHYTAEEMVGKKVMVLVNLKPAKLAGVLSEGMLLCAEDADGNLSLMVPEKKMPAGAEIC